jgi:hypothetical protein
MKAIDLRRCGVVELSTCRRVGKFTNDESAGLDCACSFQQCLVWQRSGAVTLKPICSKQAGRTFAAAISPNVAATAITEITSVRLIHDEVDETITSQILG